MHTVHEKSVVRATPGTRSQNGRREKGSLVAIVVCVLHKRSHKYIEKLQGQKTQACCRENQSFGALLSTVTVFLREPALKPVMESNKALFPAEAAGVG